MSASELPPLDPYPLPEARHLVERLSEVPRGTRARRWVLRDDNHQHYHGVVRLSESPVLIELWWKSSASAPDQLIGLFALHLPELLAAGFVRFDRERRPGEEVRLRFYRGIRGVVYIQTCSDGPSLPIGTVDLQGARPLVASP